MKLGNCIEFLTKWTGIRWITKKIFSDCGCEERKDKLNDIKLPFKYGSK